MPAPPAPKRNGGKAKDAAEDLGDVAVVREGGKLGREVVDDDGVRAGKCERPHAVRVREQALGWPCGEDLRWVWVKGNEGKGQTARVGVRGGLGDEGAVPLV